VIQNVTGMFFQNLKIIFDMQSQKNGKKEEVKKVNFFELQNMLKFVFLHLDPSYIIIA
jgi:hypothetical protein